MKKNNKKGFTLAELLIVVAIIAVLVAIAIPVFNSQLEKARDSTDQANIRSAYAQFAVEVLDGTLTADASGTFTATYNVDGKGTNAAWDNLGAGESFVVGGNNGDTDNTATVAAVANFTQVTFTLTSAGALTATLS